MKKLFIFITTLFVSISLFAQKSITDDDLEKHNFFEYKADPPNSSLLKNTNAKSIIWTRDSTYKYGGKNDTQWELQEREIILAVNANGNITKSISHFFDATTGKWTKKDSISSNFYPSGNRQNYLKKSWNTASNQWSDTVSYFDYAENGYYKTAIYRIWDYSNNQFSSYGNKKIFTFGDNGYWLSSEEYNWNSTNENWELNRKWSYIFNEQVGKMAQFIYQTYDDDAGEWVNYGKGNYTYDDNGNKIEYIFQTWDKTNNQWVNYQKSTYTYDANGNNTQYLNQKWDASSQTWTNYYKSTYTFDDNGNRINTTSFSWDKNESVWIKNRQTIYTYDDDDNLVQYLYQKWDSNTNTWVDDTKATYGRDANGNVIQYVKQNWDSEAGMWTNYLKYDNYWSSMSTATENIATNITLYPNPAHNTLYIKGINSGELSIFTMDGKLVTHKKISTNKINISNLQPNSYLIIINSQNKTIVRKFIKH